MMLSQKCVHLTWNEPVAYLCELSSGIDVRLWYFVPKEQARYWRK